MKAKHVMALAVAVALGWSGPAIGATKTTKRVVKTTTKVATTKAPATTKRPVTPAVPAPVVLEGTGTYVGPSAIPFATGTIVATMSHDGSSNFQVHLINPSNGEKEVFLANEIGVWSGQAADEIDRDTNLLVSVVADGHWTLKIEHPRPTTGLKLPQTFSGKGSVVIGTIEHTGGARFTMSHDGSSNFQVHGYSPMQGKDLFIANEIGAWKGTTIEAMRGVRLLTVVADGNWTITVDPT